MVIEILAGTIIALHQLAIPRFMDIGTHLQKERDAERARVKWILHRGLILKPCGVIFTTDLVTRPIGALKTLTALAVQHPVMTDCGARPATVLAIPPVPVLPPLFAFPKKEKVKERNRVMPATMEIAIGKAKTFPQTIILTKLFQLCTTHLLLLPRDGGRIMS